ncbi:MAG: DUF1223 domain-containing protein [Pseudomonadales bacterium]
MIKPKNKARPHSAVFPKLTTVALLSGLMLCSLFTPAVADSVEKPSTPQIFKSSVEQTSLLELYTSQGCYSCPPAENWLNALINSDSLWQKVIPVALHVDYWDYLGWKDPYGEKRNQERHYAYKNQGHTRAIYTPEMILNGTDYTIWRKGELPDFNTGNNVGELELSRTENGIKLFFNSQDKDTKVLRANVALLGFGIETSIKAGENAGKILKHEFVALAQDSKVAHPVGQLYLWQFPDIESGHARARSALIAWLDTEDNNQPIQAVGGWID